MIVTRRRIRTGSICQVRRRTSPPRERLALKFTHHPRMPLRLEVMGSGVPVADAWFSEGTTSRSRAVARPAKSKSGIAYLSDDSQGTNLRVTELAMVGCCP